MWHKGFGAFWGVVPGGSCVVPEGFGNQLQKPTYPPDGGAFQRPPSGVGLRKMGKKWGWFPWFLIPYREVKKEPIKSMT